MNEGSPPAGRDQGQAVPTPMAVDPALAALLRSMVQSSPDASRRFVAEVLAPLEGYDAATGSSLLGTLASYLACDASTERTATSLHLHRHSVRYRLGRVADLSGHNPHTTSGRQVLGLALALHALLSPELRP